MNWKWRKPDKKGVSVIKHGKRPTVKQCKLMEQWRLNPADWLVVKDEPAQMTVVHRHSDTTIRIIHKE